jgi:H2-forming N5,N10-methylenetetrahydromethanopterin dehydrogenase-like enzyme
VRIDDFKELTEEEQVERVKEMLRSLGKPGGDAKRG